MPSFRGKGRPRPWRGTQAGILHSTFIWAIKPTRGGGSPDKGTMIEEKKDSERFRQERKSERKVKKGSVSK